VSDSPYRENLTDDQLETLEKAAFLVINARNEAAAILRRSGVEPEQVPDFGWFGSPCGVILPPPPQNHPCGCSNYTGDGGLCLTSYVDFTGPDFGTGPPRRTCEHLPSQHLPT
jgi:hypothetical protein